MTTTTDPWVTAPTYATPDHEGATGLKLTRLTQANDEDWPYRVTSSFEAATGDDTCWSFYVMNNCRVHAALEFPADEDAQDVGLQSLTADDCVTIARALLEAAEQVRHQEHRLTTDPAPIPGADNLMKGTH